MGMTVVKTSDEIFSYFSSSSSLLLFQHFFVSNANLLAVLFVIESNDFNLIDKILLPLSYNHFCFIKKYPLDI